MDYTEQIRASLGDAAGLEILYRQAVSQKQESRFTANLEELYQGSPNDLLLTAWHHRLAQPVKRAAPAPTGIRWSWAVILGLVLGGLFFLLTGQLGSTYGKDCVPIWAAVISAAALIIYLVVAGVRTFRWPLIVLGALAGLAVYATIFAVVASRSQTYPMQAFQVNEQYPLLALIHVLGLAGLGVIWVAVGWRSSPGARHSAFVRAIEIGITAGLFGALGGFVLVLGIGLFGALGINLNTEIFMRLVFSVAGGFVPLLAMALIYDPRLSPEEQDFSRGFSKVLTILLRILLPVGLVGLLIYAAVIPFYFWQPFNNRDVLIIYNVFLFAVMFMVVGAVPLPSAELRPAQLKWLRLGLTLMAGLTILISVYALSAVIYRTALSGFTANRLTVIGWNIVNIGLLAVMLARILPRKQP
ncbi:MAG: hypothetical protein ACYC6L_11580, partial [Anaerolineae bacterium]